ncbi:hypothetical protein D9Q98_006118 [Chlorella vulgaris]|uniref:Amine oxidase domain-containing protein n=1 Tax=Chlorella vulgaris TaxID=3077 RepID=A0A9D4TWZ0_CHLVU|nr:hypothetical protein D9Q98_006118 [Chlorella vulgaris]
MLTAQTCGAGTKAIVIGGGAGGLAVAGRLARAGLDVHVIEKNEEVGGRVQSVASPNGTFRHDTGPSLLLFPDKYQEAFEGMGTSLQEQGIKLARVQPAAYRVWFAGGGGHLDLLNDEAAMAAQLEAVEPGAADGYRRFLRMARNNLSMGVPHFIDREFSDLASARGLQDLIPFLPKLNVLDLLGQHDWRLQQFFKDQRLRAMFTFQDLYVGLTPYSAPAVFGLLAGTELTDGVWYPLGGFGQIRDGLRRAAEACGVRVTTGVEVKAMTTDAVGSRVTGVVLADGTRLAADLIVCNRDLAAAYDLLSSDSSSSDIGNSGSSSSSGGGTSVAPSPSPAAAAYGQQQHERLGKLKYSSGVIAYNWCLGKQVHGLLHHNVFLSEQWRQSWHPAAHPNNLVEHPNFYVHVPSRTDPSAAPPGCDSVMVLLPVANQQQLGGTDYAALVTEGRQRILTTFADAGLGDVGASIQHEHVIAPPDWEQRYGLRHGAAFGLAHGLDQLSIFRPANKDRRVAGLYFVGASTRPGNGVPLCLIGAKLTAARVLKDLQAAAVIRNFEHCGTSIGSATRFCQLIGGGGGGGSQRASARSSGSNGGHLACPAEALPGRC